MKKLCAALLLLTANALWAQDPVPPPKGEFQVNDRFYKTETVAAVTTRTGIVEIICIKQPADSDLPTTKYLLRSPEDQEGTLVILPGVLAVQDEMMENVLDTCIQNQLKVVISGPLVKHIDTGVGATETRTFLVLRRIELNIFEESGRIRQTLIFTLE